MIQWALLYLLSYPTITLSNPRTFHHPKRSSVSTSITPHFPYLQAMELAGFNLNTDFSFFVSPQSAYMERFYTLAESQ